MLLDEVGRGQAAATAARLGAVPLAALVSSPLERCRETARAIAGPRARPRIQSEKRLTECDYGSWQGGSLKELAKEDLWKKVQQQPVRRALPRG